MSNQSDYEADQINQWEAIFTAGQMAGLSFHLDTEALRKFLTNVPADFKYEALSKAAIVFAESVRKGQ